MDSKYEWASAKCVEAEVYLSLARYDNDRKDYIVAALDLYQEVLAMTDVEIAQPYIGLAYLAFSTGRPEEALGLLNTAQDIEPANLNIVRLRTEIEKALQSGSSALEVEPQNLNRIERIQDTNTPAATASGGLGRLFQSLEGLSATPAELFQLIKQVFNYSLSKSDAEFLLTVMQGKNQGDLKADFERFSETLAKIKPEFGQNVQSFIKQLASSEPGQLRRFQRFLRPLKSQLTTPKMVYDNLKAGFNQEWSKEDATALYQFIQTGSPSAQAPVFPDDLQKVKALLKRLDKNFEQDAALLALAEDLAPDAESLPDSELDRLDQDRQPLEGKIQSPKHVFELVKQSFGVELSKPKASALGQLINTGCLDGKHDLHPGDLQKLQLLLIEFKLLQQAELEKSGEWGKSYGAETALAFRELIKALQSRL